MVNIVIILLFTKKMIFSLAEKGGENMNKQEQNKRERFAIVPYWVYDTPKLSSTDKLVFSALCMFRNKQGFCFPSVKELSRITSLGKTCVHEALGRLEEHGTIRKRNRYREKGKTSNEYFISSVSPFSGLPMTASRTTHDRQTVIPTPPNGHEQYQVTSQINRGGEQNKTPPFGSFEHVMKLMMGNI